MGRQYNKVIKRKRRANYLKRKGDRIKAKKAAKATKTAKA
jgi:hypothetical protein